MNKYSFEIIHKNQVEKREYTSESLPDALLLLQAEFGELVNILSMNVTIDDIESSQH